METALYPYLAVVVTLCTGLSLGITISAYIRHRLKKSRLTKILVILFINFSTALVFSTLAIYYEMNGLPSVPFDRIPFYFLTIGTYFMYVFSRIVFREKEKREKIDVLVIVLACGVITFGLIRDFSPALLLITALEATRQLLSMVFSILIALPIFIGAIKIKRRISPDDSHQSHLSYITIMSFAYLLVITSFILENVISEFSQIYPNAFSFSAYIITVFALFSAYRGFFSKKEVSGGN